MTDFGFTRQYRTPASEGYLLRKGGDEFGRVDLHFGFESVFATLVLIREADEAETLSLIEEIDEHIVLSAESSRDDFYVTVYQGKEVGFYTDEFLAEHRRRERGEANGQE
ncbi:MAG: hypothetical protein QF609_00115 [Gammaproteobacteria bacterium]|nr:hypothetical protein [Gammaproteobacteria bacterium]